MKFSDYAKALGELGPADRDKLLVKARCDGTLTVADYIKLEQLDQALTSIEQKKGEDKHES